MYNTSFCHFILLFQVLWVHLHECKLSLWYHLQSNILNLGLNLWYLYEANMLMIPLCSKYVNWEKKEGQDCQVSRFLKLWSDEYQNSYQLIKHTNTFAQLGNLVHRNDLQCRWSTLRGTIADLKSPLSHIRRQIYKWIMNEWERASCTTQKGKHQ